MLQAFEYNACHRRCVAAAVAAVCAAVTVVCCRTDQWEFLQSVALFAGEHDVWPHDGRRSRQESNHGCCQLDVCDVKHQNGTRSTHHDGRYQRGSGRIGKPGRSRSVAR